MRRSEALPRTVRMLLLARIVNRLGAFSLPFLTVLISTRHGAGLTTAGLVTSTFGLATIPSRLAGGRLADRIGRRTTIVLGLCACAAAQALIAASASLTWTVGGAVLLGLAFELYEPPSQAIISESVPPGQRVRAFSLFSAALAVGGMGAGLLAALLGRWDLRRLFVADAVTCLACALLVRLALPRDRPALPAAVRLTAQPGGSGTDQCGPSAADRAGAGTDGVGAGTDRAGAGTDRAGAGTVGVGPDDVPPPVRPLRDRALMSVLATGTAYALINQQTAMSLPLALARQGRPAADAGLLFTAAAVTTVLAQPLVRLPWLARLAPPRALALAHLLLAAGLTGYALLHGLPALLAATSVGSLGDLLVMGRVYALVAELAPPGGSGRYLAVFGTSWGISATLAPVLGTQVLARAGATALWSATATLCVLLAALHLWVTPHGPARAGDPRGRGGRRLGSSCAHRTPPRRSEP